MDLPKLLRTFGNVIADSRVTQLRVDEIWVL